MKIDEPMPLGVVLALLALLAVPPAALAGPTDAAKCQAKQNQVAGKYESCLATAQMKLVKTAGFCTSRTAMCYRDDDCPVSETCDKDTTKYDEAVAKCADKLVSSWSKIADKAAGSCPSSLDSAYMQQVLSGYGGRVAHDLAADARYVDNGDGTITDRATGLLWEKKVNCGGDNPTELHLGGSRFSWSGSCSISDVPCQPSAEAAAACSAATGSVLLCAQCGAGEGDCDVPTTETPWTWLVALNASAFAGHSDWRLPSRIELSSIVEDSDGATEPLVDTAFEGVGGSCSDIADPQCSCTQTEFSFWTDSVLALGSEDEPWVVSFASGTTEHIAYDSTTGVVRAVRGRW